MSNIFDLGNTNVALALDCPFPANVNSGPGIAVTKSGGIWNVSLNYPPLTEETVPVPGNIYGAFWDSVAGIYAKVRMDNLIAAATGLDTRQPTVDANYNVTIHDRYVALTMAFTAPRTFTMPPASSVPGGREVMIEDEVGAITSANYLLIVPTGTDTISGKAFRVLATTYGGLRLRSNGTNAWNIVAATSVYRLPGATTAYTCSPDDQVVVAQNITAPLVVTLPTAANYPTGRRLTIADNSGTCSPTNTLTVKPFGSSDTINMQTAPPIATLNAPCASITLISDGQARWTVVAGGNITASATITSAQISDASALGRQLLTNAVASASRAALQSGATGDTIFTAATPAAAQSAMGLGSMATQAANGVNITGGTISSVAISNGTVANATISSPTITGGTISGVSAAGAVTLSPANANIAISPTGTGTVTVNPATAGHIDNTIIGATVPAAASVTSMNGGPLSGTRNMIINGTGRVDQRNANATTTPGSGYTYFGDRWQLFASVASKLNMTCGVALGGVLGDGIGTYIGAAVASAYAPASGEAFLLTQRIEGRNAARLGWGSASAQPATLSFWANALAAGTYNVTLTNGATANRFYLASFTLAANTWTLVKITIPGDTAGTWAIDSSDALEVRFTLGYGSSLVGTAGVWSAANVIATSGAVNHVSNSGGGFYVTGVQLELGPVATPYEWLDAALERRACERYYQRYTSGTANAYQLFGYGGAGGLVGGMYLYPSMRASPTLGIIGTWTPTNCSAVAGYTSGSLNSAIIYTQVTAAGQCSNVAQANSGFDLNAEL